MEPVTKWSPKQVVDWTRGEEPRGPESPTREMGRVGSWGRGAQSLLRARSAESAVQRQCTLLQSGLCAPRFCPCFRGCGLCQAEGNPIFKPRSEDGLSTERECSGCLCRDRGPGVRHALCSARLRCRVPWLSVLERKAQSAFVWVTPLGPHKCRLPGAVAGMPGRLDRYGESPAARRASVFVGEGDRAVRQPTLRLSRRGETGRQTAPDSVTFATGRRQ